MLLEDLDKRLSDHGKNVLYVGPSNLGKTLGITGRLAFGGTDNATGVTGVLHVSFRQASDSTVFQIFASSVGIEDLDKKS